MRERRVCLRHTQAIADALELSTRLQSEPPAAFDGTLGMLDPAGQKQALTAAEWLVDGGKIALAFGHVAAGRFAAAEQIADLRQHGFGLCATEQVSAFREDGERPFRPAAALGRIAQLRADVPEQPVALRRAQLVADVLEFVLSALDVNARLGRSTYMAERLGPPAVLVGPGAAFESAAQKVEISERGTRLARAIPRALQEVEQQVRCIFGVARLDQVVHALPDHAPRRCQRMVLQRFGSSPIDELLVGPLRELCGQVLLQERVRPAVAARSAWDEDFGLLHGANAFIRRQAEAREQRHQHLAPEVRRNGGGGVGGQPLGLGHRLQPTIPKLRRGARAYGEHLGWHVVAALLLDQGTFEGPGVQLLQGEERVASASTRGLFHGLFVESQRFAQELARRFGLERCDVDDDTAHLLAEQAQAFGSRRAQVYLFGPHGGDDHVVAIGVLAVHAQEPFERRFRRVLQVVDPDEQLVLLANLAHHVTGHRAPGRQGVDGEAHAARADGHVGGWPGRPEPFRRARHPGASDLVVLAHAPALQERALDRAAISALEIVIANDGTDHAVDRPAHAPVARLNRDHRALFVHGLAQPFGDATLPRTCRPDQDHQAMVVPVAVDDLVADLPQQRADLLPTDQRTLPDVQEAVGALGVGLQVRIATGVALTLGERARRGGADARQLVLLRIGILGAQLVPFTPRLGREFPAIPGLLGQTAMHEGNRSAGRVDGRR